MKNSILKKLAKTLFALTILCFSCSKDDNNTKEQETSGTQVYVAGFEEESIGFNARVWKNGVATDLSGGFQSSANSVFVSGNDVYVAGVENNGTHDVATVWKNGVATNLTNGAGLARAFSIFVKTNN